jgi:AcrR family transcriptional regulator
VVTDPTTELDAGGLATRRPRRADARRNFDALLTAARDAFAEQGTEASLEDVARRAGVGIGTLYRHFPTRQDLFESVYLGEIEQLGHLAGELTDAPPWEALTEWLRRFVDYVATKRALSEALNRESELMRSCRDSMYAAGTPLFERAQASGDVRRDLSFDDLLRLVSGITGAAFVDDDQRNRVLEVALDGVRSRA